MRPICGLSHDWVTERRSGLASSWLPPSRDAPRDRRGRRRLPRDPYHIAVCHRHVPPGSSTYGSLKTYTGHRPRIIFRSQTRERRTCVCAECSISTTAMGEHFVSSQKTAQSGKKRFKVGLRTIQSVASVRETRAKSKSHRNSWNDTCAFARKTFFDDSHRPVGK